MSDLLNRQGMLFDEVLDACDKLKQEGILTVTPGRIAISFSGYAGNGKSVFVRNLYNYLVGTTNYTVFLYKEPARVLNNMFLRFSSVPNYAEKDWSLSMIALQVENMENFEKVSDELLYKSSDSSAYERGEKRIVGLFDRNVIDELSFAVVRGVINLSDAKIFLEELADRFFFSMNLIVLFRPIVNKETLKKILNDSLREKVLGTEEAFKKQQEQFFVTYSELLKVWKDKSPGTQVLKVPSISEAPCLETTLLGCLLALIKGD